MQVLVFIGGYHGGVFSFLPNVKSRSMNARYSFVLAPYNDVEGTAAVISDQPDDVAAILVEPMQGAGGCIPATVTFLQYLREVSTSIGALLIFDEVMTSRCAWGELQTKYGIHPDLCKLGKWIGGGLNFGAFGGRRQIMQMFDPENRQLVHSGTFNNNVVTMAAGFAGLELLCKSTLDNMNHLGDVLREQLQSTIQRILATSGTSKGNMTSAEKLPNVQVTGLGSVMNVTFLGHHKETLQGLFYHHMLSEGIYLATRGYVALSIETQELHIAKFMSAMESFLGEYSHGLVD
jgi:glutamate-1-semialdehyde 2,1-aminomutase